LDDISRERRQRKMIDALEMDNFQEEPHADLVMSKKAPKFAETVIDTSPPKEKGSGRAARNKKHRPPEFYKKYRKTFAQLLEEDLVMRGNEFNYASAQVGPSQYPPRKFCNVCGLPSTYTCGQCGVRYCTAKCYKTHQETRCLKWTA
jgi:zinc finger HIT domain-containing protein 1